MFPAKTVFGEDFNPQRLMNPDQYQIYMQRYTQLKPRFAWSDKLEKVYAGFLVHRSMNVPGKIAYFQNISAMIENRFTRTSPEMFLARTLGPAPEMVRALWSVEVCGNVLPAIHYVENDEPGEWRDIYDGGPHSCMAGSHLVELYAHPENNLALAYVLKDGKIICRTIVNRDKMQYVRIYTLRGQEEETNSFVAALNMAGFQQSCDAMLGERIRIYYTSCNRCERPVIRGPYIDGSTQCVRVDKHEPGKPKALTAVIHAYGDELYYGDCDDDIHCGCEEGDDWDEEEDHDEEP